ncbi:T9SS type A sorting domain-containing protein [Adhaeribacter soli]|uniref:T9SS type A sorting domain-containing protein n=1 Tax=Adhaeribacter soli TaxID=2607655 RepID=A0A5N1J4Q4_9BACT|nr:T9SS type A sorting domain-containing protein [Adhaeribacter soli]KAA9340059.1 T9SS type A sorting domain-containing protein [Adhaeribacter soli]
MKNISLHALTITLVFFVALQGMAQMPAWQWAVGKGISQNLLSAKTSLETDTLGNSYVAGAGLSKYSPEGKLLWSKDIKAMGLSKDAAGNLYVVGTFQGSVYLGNTTLTAPPLNITVFLAKFDQAGNTIWAKKGPSSWEIAPNDGASIKINGISTDSAGNSLFTGFCWGNADFDSVSLIPNSSVTQPIYFAAKYDQQGQVKWARSYPYIQEAVIGTNDNYFLHDGSTLSNYNENGALLWQKSFTTSSNNSNAQITCLETDESGNCFVAGSLSGSVTIDGITLQNSGFRNALLVKFNPAGTLLWAKTSQALSASSQPEITAIKAGPNGRVYITGNFTDSITFDNSLPALTAQANQAPAFVSKLSSTDGAPYWQKQTSGFLYQSSIADLPDGESVTAGFFQSPGCSFDNINLNYASGYNRNLFLAKLSTGTTQPLEPVTEPEPAPEPSITAQFYPNPANSEIRINMPDFENAKVLVFNVAGQKIYTDSLSAKGKLEINVTAWPASMYLVKITAEGKAQIQKLLVTH